MKLDWKPDLVVTHSCLLVLQAIGTARSPVKRTRSFDMKNLCRIHREDNNHDSHGYLEPLVTPLEHPKYLEIIDSHKQPCRSNGAHLTNGNRKPGLLGSSSLVSKPVGRSEYSQLAGQDEELDRRHSTGDAYTYQGDNKAPQGTRNLSGGQDSPINYAQIASPRAKDSSGSLSPRENTRLVPSGGDKPTVNYTQLAAPVPSSDVDTDNELNEMSEAVSAARRNSHSPTRSAGVLNSALPRRVPGSQQDVRNKLPSQRDKLGLPPVHKPGSSGGSSGKLDVSRNPSPFSKDSSPFSDSSRGSSPSHMIDNCGMTSSDSANKTDTAKLMNGLPLQKAVSSSDSSY